jgi:hypothetical protein
MSERCLFKPRPYIYSLPKRPCVSGLPSRPATRDGPVGTGPALTAGQRAAGLGADSLGWPQRVSAGGGDLACRSPQACSSLRTRPSSRPPGVSRYWSPGRARAVAAAFDEAGGLSSCSLAAGYGAGLWSRWRSSRSRDAKAGMTRGQVKAEIKGTAARG